MNVGLLMREREELVQRLASRKADEKRLKLLNQLIALEGGDNVTLLEHKGNGKFSVPEGTLCEVPDCENPVYIRGLCSPHYAQSRRKGPDAKRLQSYMTPSKTFSGGGKRK